MPGMGAGGLAGGIDQAQLQQAQQMLRNNPQLAAQLQQAMNDPAQMEALMRRFGGGI